MTTFFHFTETQDPIDDVVYKDTLGNEWQYNSIGRIWFSQHGVIPVDTLGKAVICTIVDAVLPEHMGLVPWIN
jgi:hypothetical protein